MITDRRWILTGLASTLAAPAVIRIDGLLMPVRPVPRAELVFRRPVSLLNGDTLRIFGSRLNTFISFEIAFGVQFINPGDTVRDLGTRIEIVRANGRRERFYAESRWNDADVPVGGRIYVT
jgi:hypothetical protein